MTTKKEENGETTFSLLGRKQKLQLKPKSNTRTRCGCVCLTVVLVVISLLAVTVFISFAESTKTLRCKTSDNLNLGLVECAPADILESLSSTYNGTHHIKNATAVFAKHRIEEPNSTVCGNQTDIDGGQFARRDDVSANDREAELRSLAEQTYDVAYEIMYDSEGWQLDQGSSHKTGRVYSKTFEDIGRVSRLEVHFEASLDQIRTLMIDEVDKLPTWNPTMAEVNIVERFGDDMAIVHLVTGASLGGIISGRDFVNLRYWRTVDNVTVVAEKAVTHPDVPLIEHLVRGFHRPGGFMFGPVKNRPSKVLFRTCASADIGMWMPQFLLDRAKARAMMEFVERMDVKLKQLKNQ